ncbi:hypothetical protein PV327_002530 [Microctonus hyperodae]|uniref:Small ribosomal subunit protein uS9m n=1 Tax=Microctonus hyperodae TaxID=165561 RepID=A0AA39KP74_MICHY|nr:hypothetical protein PV327_002530 [Microctonus hyperodae]
MKMALSSARAILGRHALHRNVMKTFDNSQRNVLCLSLNYSTVNIPLNNNIDADSIFDTSEITPNKKKLSKAMKAYLERAKEYDEFIQKEKKEYQIGKRHLANMMGMNPEEFTQEDVQKSIEYLFPSGLFDKKARPIMEEPSKIFPPRKEAEFDESGRPFHSMFYTLRPNFYESLYNMIEELEKLNKLEDEELRKGLLPNAANKMNADASSWVSLTDLQNLFLENVIDKEYENFINAGERLINHPYSENAREFIMKYRVTKALLSDGLMVLPLEYDNQGRPFVTVKDSMRKSSEGVVKVLGNGSGKITINGKDITYFKRIQHREQIIFPLIFTNMQDKVDVEATVWNGGPTGQAGVIRWGISWALRSFVDAELIEKMRLAGLLSRDWRNRERKKPGQEGARRKFTWRKR